MSVLSLIKQPEVKSYLRDKIRNPLYGTTTNIVSGTDAPQVMGMALDYALRGGLTARHGLARQPLVAERALEFAALWSPRVEEKVQALLSKSLRAYAKIDASAALPSAAAKGCLILARLEMMRRSHDLYGYDRKPSSGEVDELQRLYTIIPWDDFVPREQIYLNPGFGPGSILIGGADADVVVDDTVIDIKTIKKQTLEIETVRQLVIYGLLARRFGLNGGAPLQIQNIGVYFARAGELRVWPLTDALAEGEEDAVLDYLFKRAEQNLRERMNLDDEGWRHAAERLERESGIASASWNELSAKSGIPVACFLRFVHAEELFDHYRIHIAEAASSAND
jgi:hypothetical protein